jgi:hypothetical protein
VNTRRRVTCSDLRSEARAIAVSPEDKEFVDVLAARAVTPVGPAARVNDEDPPRKKTSR